jgi:glyoxylase-like metal-dependent hydrolase (beta-lactamase superfamily II)
MITGVKALTKMKKGQNMKLKIIGACFAACLVAASLGGCGKKETPPPPATEVPKAVESATTNEPVAAPAAGQPTDAPIFGEILPGIRLRPTPGHVPYHQAVLVGQGGEVACFLGDLVPTAAHLPAAWIMGYDLEPLVTLETKKRVLTRAAVEEWQLIFEHDAAVARARVATDARHGYDPTPLPIP